jgi:hypothetical protein
LCCPSLEGVPAQYALLNHVTMLIHDADGNDFLCQVNPDGSKLAHDFTSYAD